MHDHHHHSHTVSELKPGKVNTAFIVAIALNVIYIVAEVAAGLLNNSISLLGDAGHNVSDVASLLISLLALRLAERKSTKRFTYGFKKTTVLAALANAVILLVAVGVLGYEVVRRLLSPVEIRGDVVAWVAGLGILVNACSALLFFRNRKSDLNVRSAFLHLAADALVSLGVVIAGVVMSFTGWQWLDPVVGMAVLLVVLASTWNLLAESFRLSVDAVPEGIELAEVKKVIENVPDVVHAYHIHVWAMSTTEIALTAHVRINQELSFEEKVAVVQSIKHELEHMRINHSTIEIE
jgi:cobalt-zinc-cadmium efflux system protein